MRATPEQILLVGDSGREVEAALAAALPAARVTTVPSYFDAIAELSMGQAGGHAGAAGGLEGYTAVVASAEPIERRPEPAVRVLRQLAGARKLVLFGHPTLEPLSRKMLEVGCDDYVVCPPSPHELQKVLGRPTLRLVPAPPPGVAEAGPEGDAYPEGEEGDGFDAPPAEGDWSPSLQTLESLDLADLFLDALAQHPNTAPAACVKQINALIAPATAMAFSPRGKGEPAERPGTVRLSHPVRAAGGASAAEGPDDAGHLHLFLPEEEATEATTHAARHALARIAALLAKVVTLQERHNALQKLAITDQLTGAYNRRYFEHFLQRILERARTMRFGVTLLLFDIDDFKKYNDQFGHGLGDEILRETATLMKRCCREHDLVARIGGDEFAVVFWEKEGPRQPKDPARPAGPSPFAPRGALLGPRQIFDRFRRILGTRQFEALGPSGRGVLSISGGFADFPWDGHDMTALLSAADRDLMFGAKKQKKVNQILLVGDGTERPDEGHAESD